MTTHPLALSVADAYLGLVDAAVPGFVEALYLVGSAAMGDFRPPLSDVDFVAVSPARPGAGETAALAKVHAGLALDREIPALDGIYLTWDDLRAGPFAIPSGPCVKQGRFLSSGCHDRHPLTWSVLGASAVTVRGPLCAGTGLWRGPADLERWALARIDEHRGSWLEPDPGSDAEPPATEAVERTVLGMCRLHYILSTRVVPSKSDAGLYGLITFQPEWHRIIDEALRIRREPEAASLYGTPAERRRDALAFARLVADDAYALGFGRGG
ncbi:DNA polymerase subunit beta [Methylobacterium variabile]|uniref:Aminoglycoside (3'') (9) adenylyltransferase n=1 Tax=Methylobacterium variabile TaxID=298794 RepID=A0A0J6SJ55_9HYPH|nr:nucleotidyltransferase domain-containing protein [Methylobacterium variabile]KMO35315.1 DNA polymerase subunit beta [Methylobacterium variabile]